MSSSYKVKTVMLAGGERLPMLVGQDGLPLFEAAVYSLVELRSRNRAANTIDASLRSLMLFYIFLDLREISLSERLKQGSLLSLAEIEDLVRFVRMPLESVVNPNKQKTGSPVSLRTVSIENYRNRIESKEVNEVLPMTAANRLRVIRDYISWISLDRFSRHGLADSLRHSISEARQMVCSAITARLPSDKKHGSLALREGLEPEVLNRLFQVIDPLSPENPWSDEHSRHRNALIIHLLHALGVRRGELLGLRISDINFQKGTAIVARRADDPSDPRRYQPNAKTRAREIPMSQALVDMTKNYIMGYRRSLPEARRHDFLFVSTDTGAPLSIPALNKVFSALKKKCPAIPEDFCPHVLRHTWNDLFSEECDRNKVSEDVEKKTRSYLMGWSETSGTSATYTRRHIRKKAQEVSLAMQKKMMKEENYDE